METRGEKAEKGEVLTPPSLLLSATPESLSLEITSCHSDVGLARLVGILDPSSGGHSQGEKRAGGNPKAAKRSFPLT